MRNFKILFLSLIVTIVIVSCQKSTDIEDQSTLTTATNRTGPITPTQSFYDNGPNDYGCQKPVVDCLPEVTVDGQALTDVTDQIFSNGSASSSFVTNNYSVLSSLLEDHYLNGVISNTYTLTTRGTFSSTTTGYLIFKQAGAVVRVQPVRK